MLLFELLLAIGASLCYGFSDYLAGLLSRKRGPLEGLLAFCLFALPVFLLAIPFSPLPWPPSLEMVLLFLFFAICYLAGYALFFRALEKGSLAIVSPLSAIWPLITVSLAMLFLGERPSSLQLLGAGVLVVGTVLAGIDWRSASKTRWVAGALDAVGAALLWGISLGVAKPLVLAWGPLLPALFLFIFMTLALYIFLRPPLSRIRSSLDPVAAGAGILIAFGWLAANTAVQTVPVSLLSPISATYPLVTIALAYSRLGERPQPLQWFGIALAIAGVALVSL